MNQQLDYNHVSDKKKKNWKNKKKVIFKIISKIISKIIFKTIFKIIFKIISKIIFKTIFKTIIFKQKKKIQNKKIIFKTISFSSKKKYPNKINWIFEFSIFPLWEKKTAFLVDCNQISVMLKKATSRSLLLIDEFGKGTNPVDGFCLVSSVIKYLLGKGNECPKAILCKELSGSDFVVFRGQKTNNFFL